MSELLPCPFCGGEAHTYRTMERRYCAICNEPFGASVGPFDTEAEAIAAWNERAESRPMRVYIVKQDNGEEYEDYADFIAGVYTSEDKALDAIKRAGFSGKHRYGSRFYWTRTVDVGGYDMTESAWIEEYEVEE